MGLNDGGAAGAGGAGDGAGTGSAADITGGAAAAGAAAAGDGGAGAGAGTGDGAGGAGGDPAGGADPAWYEHLSVERGENENAANRDVAKAKGWRTMDDVVKSYREAEKAIRDGGRVKIPGEGSPPEEVASFRKAIGVPEDAKGYEFKAPVLADGSEVPMDTAALEAIGQSGIEHGIPKAGLEAVVSSFVKVQLDRMADAEQQMATDAQAVMKSFGAEAPAKEAAMTRAIQALGLSGDDAKGIRAVLGAERALKMFAQLGEGMAEDRLITGGSGKFGVSAETAKAELDTLKQNPDWMAKAMVPGSAENQRYERLVNAMGEAADRAAAAGRAG